MDTQYIENIFASALVNQTISGCAEDSELEVQIVYLTTGLCAIKSFDEKNIYIELYTIDSSSITLFWSRYCHQETEDAGYLDSLFSSVYSYADIKTSSEYLYGAEEEDLKTRVINHRSEYL